MLELDPFDLPTLQRQDADRRHNATADKRVEAEDWSWLMASKRGRRVVRELLDHCGLLRSSYTGTSETYFREGQRAVGLHILRTAWSHAPEQCTDLLKDGA